MVILSASDYAVDQNLKSGLNFIDSSFRFAHSLRSGTNDNPSFFDTLKGSYAAAFKSFLVQTERFVDIFNFVIMNMHNVPKVSCVNNGSSGELGYLQPVESI